LANKDILIVKMSFSFEICEVAVFSFAYTFVHPVVLDTMGIDKLSSTTALLSGSKAYLGTL
jgi:hypothetical protein